MKENTYTCIHCGNTFSESQGQKVNKDWKYNSEKQITEWTESQHKTLICQKCC